MGREYEAVECPRSHRPSCFGKFRVSLERQIPNLFKQSIVFLVTFLLFEIKRGSNSVFLSKVLFRRNMIGAFVATVCIWSSPMNGRY